MRSLVSDVVDLNAMVREQAVAHRGNAELVEVLHDVYERLAQLQLSMLAAPMTGRMFVPPAVSAEAAEESLCDQLGW